MSFASQQLVRYRNVPDSVRYLSQRLPDETPNDDDDFFIGSSIDASWTESTVTGSATWTQSQGVMSLKADSGATGDATTQLESITASGPPYTIETALKMWDYAGDFHSIGIVFTDGTASSSLTLSAQLSSRANGTTQFQAYSGTLTDTNNSERVSVDRAHPFIETIYIRVVQTAANTWAFNYSSDGVSWEDINIAPFSFTMTPTHFGLMGTNFASTTVPLMGTWHYFRVYESDLDV